MPHVTRRALLLAALALLAVPVAPRPARALPPYPPTRVEVVRDTLHGVVLEDPYRWLEDQDAPETRAWIEAQNRYRESVMAEVPGLDRIRARLTQVMVVGSSGVPVERGGRYFFRRRAADQDLNVLVVRDGPRGRDRVLADPHPLSADHSTSVEYTDISPDGRLVAIGTRQGGADELTVAFRDVASGRDLPDRLGPMRFFGLVIAPDLGSVYYTTFTPEGPRVRRHAMGTDPATDPVVFGTGYGPEHFVDLALSEEGRYLLVTVSVGSAAGRSELWVKDLAADGPFTAVVRDIDAAFSGAIAGDQLYVQTNWQAPRSRILRVDLREPARERWTEVVPEGRGVIERFALAGGRIVVTTLEDVVPRVRTYAADGRALGEITFPVPGEIGYLSGRWDSDEAFFTFESLVVPTTIYRWDVATGRRTAWWRSSAPVAGERYETKQVWYPSRDGTRVPMFLVHRKGLALDGTHPLYLTGYGGFTVNMVPAFSAMAALWVEAGGVFALPNLRGGAELGEEWHRAGMLERKQNTFDDFTAAAEWLTQNGYADPARIAIRGGSNGGLLVGRRAHPAPRDVPGGAVQVPAARHGALPPVPHRAAVGARVRLGRGPGAVRGPARLLALPPRREGHGLPGGPARHRRRGHAGGPAPRPQDDRAPAGLDRLGPAGAAELQPQGGTLAGPLDPRQRRGRGRGPALPLLAAGRRGALEGGGREDAVAAERREPRRRTEVRPAAQGPREKGGYSVFAGLAPPTATGRGASKLSGRRSTRSAFPASQPSLPGRSEIARRCWPSPAPGMR